MRHLHLLQESVRSKLSTLDDFLIYSFSMRAFLQELLEKTGVGFQVSGARECSKDLQKKPETNSALVKPSTRPFLVNVLIVYNLAPDTRHLTPASSPIPRVTCSPAAVNGEDGAIHITRLRSHQEENRRGNLFGASGPSQRNMRKQAGRVFRVGTVRPVE